MDDSIRLKELQVVNGALRKGDKGFKSLFSFSKGFFTGEEGKIQPLSKEGFFLTDWDRRFLLGWGLT